MDSGNEPERASAWSIRPVILRGETSHGSRQLVGKFGARRGALETDLGVEGEGGHALAGRGPARQQPTELLDDARRDGDEICRTQTIRRRLRRSRQRP